MRNRVFNVLLALITAHLVVACSGTRLDENNPQDLFKDAEEDARDKRYAMALDKFKSLKNKFPYSNVATQAKLRIADVYFEEESFVEAAAAYESFRDMHPKHEKADYVMFRIGESYFYQLPSTIDRDLGPATKAIDAYRELLTIYPKSQHLPEAKKHLEEATEKLSGKEQYVADFYFSREMYDSAAGRYEKITTRFPGTTADQYAFWQWGQSLIKQGKTDEAKHVYRVYLSRYPMGEYTKRANDWLQGAGGQ